MTDKIKDLVTQTQKELLTQGINPGGIDGTMGPKTYGAILAYQKRGVRPVTAPKLKKIVQPDWRLAKSLEVLRAQVNTAWPRRSKISDGTIGDASHKSRDSDHNPWVDSNVVTAFDITHDVANGVDCHALAELLKEDARVKYIIWNGRIYNDTISLKWRKYTRSDPHTKHMHISVHSEKVHYDDEREWKIKADRSDEGSEPFPNYGD